MSSFSNYVNKIVRELFFPSFFLPFIRVSVCVCVLMCLPYLFAHIGFKFVYRLLDCFELRIITSINLKHKNIISFARFPVTDSV